MGYGCGFLPARISTERSSLGTTGGIQATDWYAWCWSLEHRHQALKGRGFDLEATGLTGADRLSLLFGVVTLAFTRCCVSGDFMVTKSPPKTLKHGDSANSVFTRGLDALGTVLSGRPRHRYASRPTFFQLLWDFNPLEGSATGTVLGAPEAEVKGEGRLVFLKHVQPSRHPVTVGWTLDDDAECQLWGACSRSLGRDPTGPPQLARTGKIPQKAAADLGTENPVSNRLERSLRPQNRFSSLGYRKPSPFANRPYPSLTPVRPTKDLF
jgi:hypothetical protein